MNRTLTLDDSDVLLFCAGSSTAMRLTAQRFMLDAKDRLDAAGPDPVDPETGEVKPRLWRWTFGEAQDDITTKQRGFLHAAVFPQIAEQVRVNGERFTAEIWKEYFRRLFLPDIFVMRKLPGAKRKTPLRVRVSTEDLSAKQYSEHIDRVIAHAVTEHGVEFHFNADEREAVRWKRPMRKAKQPEAVTT